MQSNIKELLTRQMYFILDYSENPMNTAIKIFKIKFTNKYFRKVTPGKPVKSQGRLHIS